jgi:large subunit ribosomal protein L10
MNKVRTAKVATVDELKAKVDSTSTAVVTEYRGMTVAQISALRRQLRSLDADYKVFKNTLVRRAIEGTAVAPLDEFLEGPTAIAFINGDVSAVAKALRDFAKATPTLVVKGGVLDGNVLSRGDLNALADLPSRDVLLARFAGLLASPMSTLAGLLKAVPQSLAYGLAALIDSRGGVGSADASSSHADVVVPDETAPVADEAVAIDEGASGEVAPAADVETDVVAQNDDENDHEDASPTTPSDVVNEPTE